MSGTKCSPLLRGQVLKDLVRRTAADVMAVVLVSV